MDVLKQHQPPRVLHPTSVAEDEPLTTGIAASVADGPAAVADGDDVDDGHGIDAADAPRARTGTVLGLLVTAALVLSYFTAYPLTHALRAAEVLPPTVAGAADPRLRWMAVSFVSLLGGFGVIAGVFRLVSGRQLRRIDEMADGD